METESIVSVRRNEVNNRFEIDLNSLMQDNPKLFEKLISSPKETLDKIREQYFTLLENKDIYFINVPKFLLCKISTLRSKDLDRLIKLSGILKKVIQPKSFINKIKFECPSCGALIKVTQNEIKIRQPTRCSCKWKGSFRVNSKELIDFQELELEENMEDIGSRQPQKIQLILQGDLTDPTLSKFQVGNKVDVIGILQEMPSYISNKEGERTVLDYIIKVIDIIPKEGYEEDLILDEKEIEQIKSISKNNPLQIISDNIAPNISGLEHIKKATTLFLAKGITKYSKEGNRIRGNIHILTVGDAGVAKSALIQNIQKRAINCRIADGKNTSKAGIVASVSQDVNSRKWSIEAGDMVLANNGYLLIDECFPKDTEVLTENGFMKFQDISKNNKIGQYHEDGKIDFVYPERIVRQQFNGDLIKIKGAFGEHISTPNHKRVIVDRKGKIKKLVVNDSLIHDYRVILNGEYNGLGVNLTDDELRFIVAFMADGCIKNKKYGYISIKKQRKIDRLNNILLNMALPHSITRSKIRKGDNTYYLGDIITKYFIEENGKYTKKYPKNWFKDLSIRQRKLIIEELVYWDGYKSSKNTWQFFTSKKEEMELIRNIAVSSGYCVNVYPRKKKGYRDNYSLTFLEKKMRNQNMRKVTSLKYNGEVYCATVPTGMIMIKQGKYIQISGNCDKLPKSDRDAMHRPMEQGEVVVSKAGIHATLQSNTSIFAVANPKSGMFSKNISIIEQIDFSPTLLSRYDLIFVLKDNPDKEIDEERAKQIINVHKGNITSNLSSDFIKKYFLYVSRLTPQLTEESGNKISLIYANLRSLSEKDGEKIGMPITPRHLEGLIRLSEAHAKLRLSNTIDLIDVEIAEGLFKHSLSDFGVNLDSGVIDLSSITTKIKVSKKDKYYKVLQLLKEKSKIKNEFKRKEVYAELHDRLGLSYGEIEEIFSMMHKEADIYESNHGTEFKLTNKD